MSDRPCPDCGRSLTAAKLGPVGLDLCLYCQGVWFDEGELQLVLKAGAPVVSRFCQKVLTSPAPPPTPAGIACGCPVCRFPLHYAESPSVPGVRPGGCTRCRGYWLKVFELGVVAHQMEEEAARAAAVPQPTSAPQAVAAAPAPSLATTPTAAVPVPQPAIVPPQPITTAAAGYAAAPPPAAPPPGAPVLAVSGRASTSAPGPAAPGAGFQPSPAPLPTTRPIPAAPPYGVSPSVAGAPGPSGTGGAGSDAEGPGAVCSGCGQPNAPGAAVCWACGGLLQAKALGVCPRCEGTLRLVESEDIVFSACDSCGGIWMEEGRLTELMLRTPDCQDNAMRQVEEHRTGKVRKRNPDVRCAACGLIMFPAKIEKVSRIPICTCPRCMAQWLDHGLMDDIIRSSRW